MERRQQRVEELKSHPWLKRLFKGLRGPELAMIEAFCATNAGADKNEFEARVNRMFMDREKPKRWKEILEVLANANC